MEPLAHLPGTHQALHQVPLSRRTMLKAAGLGAAAWLTPVAELLAREADHAPSGKTPKSLILLWLDGGPSQLETFDPHPGTDVAAGTGAIDTSVAGVQFAAGLPRVAEQMHHLTLIRSMISREGDHARGRYLAKTGYRPDPTVEHPAIGAICCHQMSVGATEIPRHVSILPGPESSRGGSLGAEYDAFRCGDPQNPVPDVAARVSDDRFQKRLADLSVIENAFARGRRRAVADTLHLETVQRARVMMDSEQLKAFEVEHEPQAVLESYGDTPFGRGCLAARRLIEVGVRCVEVTLSGWDSHVDNHGIHASNNEILDPAFAGLIADLHQRDLLDETLVVCAGEFGRTPRVNRVGGRDHWPTGFSLALAGGPVPRGQVFGATDPAGSEKVEAPHTFADVHATLLAALGIDPTEEYISPAERPIKFSEGTPLPHLLANT